MRVGALVVCFGWPRRLERCLRSLQGWIDVDADVVLACTAPGVDLTPALRKHPLEGGPACRTLSAEPREPFNRFLDRAFRAVAADAVIVLSAAESLEADPPTQPGAPLASHRALSFIVRFHSWRTSAMPCIDEAAGDASYGALGYVEDVRVRLAVRDVFDGFYADPYLRLRVIGDAPRAVAPDGVVRVRSTHELDDGPDFTPPSAYLRGALADLRARPCDPLARRTLAERASSCRTVRARQRLLVLAGAAASTGARTSTPMGRTLRALEQGDSATARSECDAVLARDAGDVDALKLRAIAHLESGLAMRALGDLRRALDIDPQCTFSRSNLDVALARLGLSRETDSAPVPEAAERRIDAAATAPDIATFVPQLSGGAGRVAADVIEALAAQYRHHLLTADDSTGGRQQLRERVESLGATVTVVRDRAALNAALRTIRPRLILAHWWPTNLPMPHCRGARRVAISHGWLPLPPRCDAYVCLDEAHARQHAYAPPDRLVVIPNGVDVDALSKAAADFRHWGLAGVKPVRRGDGAARGPVRIAVLSRLSHSKLDHRLLDVLEPLADLDVRIAIAGSGARRWQIESRRARYVIGDRLHFAGPIAHGDVPGFLAAADIGLHLTSTHHETLSVGILEMLASGLPIVAQPRGCLPTLVRHGGNGYLAEEPHELSAALRELVRSPQRRAAFAAHGAAISRSYDLSHFRAVWRAQVERWLDTAACAHSSAIS